MLCKSGSQATTDRTDIFSQEAFILLCGDKLQSLSDDLKLNKSEKAKVAVVIKALKDHGSQLNMGAKFLERDDGHRFEVDIVSGQLYIVRKATPQEYAEAQEAIRNAQ